MGRIRHDIANTKATSLAGIRGKLDLARQAIDRGDPDEASDLVESALEDLRAMGMRA